MATLEHVEKLKARANVSYEEAKEALNASGDDLLDAMIYLENAGKVPAPAHGGAYSSTQSRQEQDSGEKYTGTQQQDESFGEIMGRLYRFICGLIGKGMRNVFEVWRGGEMQFSIPVLLLIALAVLAFYVVLPLLIIGLFFGFKYRFSGRDVDKTQVNKVMDSVANAAETFKEEVKEEIKEELRDKPKGE